MLGNNTSRHLQEEVISKGSCMAMGPDTLRKGKDKKWVVFPLMIEMEEDQV
ncbi:conserved hypothetical protein [Ricinus communis]|uniref:Uncharacterized protein n=1 Tax=Ricinus communis TaxID=3988 RepID=B9SDX3_RICCO|nr:conserved hypothetical protein [Ricinus communis]